MQELYGLPLWWEGALTKVVKKMSLKNAQLLELRAGQYVPEIWCVAQEVIGTFDKLP